MRLWDRCSDCGRLHITKAGAWTFAIVTWLALAAIAATAGPT